VNGQAPETHIDRVGRARVASWLQPRSGNSRHRLLTVQPFRLEPTMGRTRRMLAAAVALTVHRGLEHRRRDRRTFAKPVDGGHAGPRRHLTSVRAVRESTRRTLPPPWSRLEITRRTWDPELLRRCGRMGPRQPRPPALDSAADRIMAVPPIATSALVRGHHREPRRWRLRGLCMGGWTKPARRGTRSPRRTPGKRHEPVRGRSAVPTGVLFQQGGRHTEPQMVQRTRLAGPRPQSRAAENGITGPYAKKGNTPVVTERAGAGPVRAAGAAAATKPGFRR